MATATHAMHFFEGTEKLLEIWFSSSSENNKHSDLRNINRCQWENLLKLVQCEIISESKDKDTTAYVLSESSMFLSKHRFILKTCGTTTLLLALKPLLRMVTDLCGFDKVDDVFYSRKNFMRPDLQHKVHQSFEEEIDLLEKLFDNGAAYALGRLNRECWYLFTIDNIGVTVPDQTLELLMTDLDPDVMHLFTKEGSNSAREATENSGIKDLIPGTKIDDFLFDPCGYSMNGILPNEKYYTIHITPEPAFSYVSFESNIPQDSYDKLVTDILDIFRPGKFLMTIFANKASVAVSVHKELHDKERFRGYTRTDHQFCQFKNYNLTYTHYCSHKAVAPPPH